MKKLLSILLVLVLCTSLMAMTASADEGGYAMKVSSHKLTKGTATVDVVVTLTANDGLGSLIVTPKYDTSVLKLVNMKCGGLEGSWAGPPTDKDPTVGNSAVWFNAAGSDSTGVIVTFTFEVLKEGYTAMNLEYSACTTDYDEPTIAVTNGYVCTAHDDTEEQTTPATCTEAGKVETVCKHCGEVIKTETINATGHAWDEGVVTTAPTCTEKGVKTFTCSSCGVTKTEDIAAKGHTEDDGTVAEGVKCGETADITYKCTECGEVTRVVTGEVVQHAWDEGEETTAPTCTEKGVKTFTCTRGCGETKTEDIAPLGHKWAEEGTVKTPATCGADGVMSYPCEREGCDETNEVAITDRPAHTPPAVEEWEIDKVNHKYTCTECGEEITTKHECQEWTQNEDGEWIGTCTICGQEVNKGDVIPAGDITPILVMCGVAVFCLLAAAAYVTYRKVAR